MIMSFIGQLISALTINYAKSTYLHTLKDMLKFLITLEWIFDSLHSHAYSNNDMNYSLIMLFVCKLSC